MLYLKYLLLLFAFFISFCSSNKAPNAKDDTQLDLLDNGLSKNEKEKKMAVCLELTQREFIEKRETYQKIVDTIKDKELFTSKDALRALFHQNLVTCYFNSDMQDINSVIGGKTSDYGLIKMFTANESTPTMFSSNQLKILESILSHNAKNTSKEFSGSISKRLNGLNGCLYFTCALLLISLSFYFAIYHLKKSITSTTGGKIKKK